MKQANKHTVSQKAQHGSGTQVAVLEMTDAFKSDFKSSVLIVSLLANLFIFTTYLVVQMTPAYDHQVIGLLLTR